jgi:hypothetical protein
MWMVGLGKLIKVIYLIGPKPATFLLVVQDLNNYHLITTKYFAHL